MKNNDLPQINLKEYKILKFLHNYYKNNKQMPYLKEIKREFNFKSITSVYRILKKLERKKYLVKIPHKHKGIRLTYLADDIISSNSLF